MREFIERILLFFLIKIINNKISLVKFYKKNGSKDEIVKIYQKYQNK